MKRDIKLLLIGSLLGVFISSVGFLCKYYYFDPRLEDRIFKRTLNNELLTEVSQAYADVQLTNDSIISFFSDNYGFQAYQIDSIYSKYYEKLQKIKTLNSKLASFGNNKQIKFSKMFLEQLWG